MLDHLDACGECLDVVAALTKEARTDARVLSWRFAAAAAAAVLAVAITVWLANHPPPPEPTSRERLVALVEVLRKEDPATFSDFAPVTRQDLRAPALERGGFRVLSPRGRVTPGRLLAQWEGVLGADTFDALVFDDLGMEVARGPGNGSFSFYLDPKPPLPPGRYVLEVTSKAPVIETARSAFEIADPAAIARFDRGIAAIEARAEEPLRSLAQAHYALRQGWLDRAREFAEAAAALAPNDPEVSLLLSHFER